MNPVRGQADQLARSLRMLLDWVGNENVEADHSGNVFLIYQYARHMRHGDELGLLTQGSNTSCS